MFTMRLFSALLLSLLLSTACGLRCYVCLSTDPHCQKTSPCPEFMDQCFSINVRGYMMKGCQRSSNCVRPLSCCGEDLCNGSASIGPTGPTVALLLVTSAITSVFL